jgi:hypothetical protein
MVGVILNQVALLIVEKFDSACRLVMSSFYSHQEVAKAARERSEAWCTQSTWVR